MVSEVEIWSEHLGFWGLCSRALGSLGFGFGFSVPGVSLRGFWGFAVLGFYSFGSLVWGSKRFSFGAHCTAWLGVMGLSVAAQQIGLHQSIWRAWVGYGFESFCI